MSPQFKITFRGMITFALLVIALFTLLIEASRLVPDLLAHPPNDYHIYANWGSAQRLGPDKFAFDLPNYYPMPTTLWVFVPLSVLPAWFSLVWIVGPLLFTLWKFGKPGVVLWLYYPMLVQAAVGQLDGLLLLPLLWLIENRPWFAGIGAALMLFKPQLSFTTILFALIYWLLKRDYHNIGAFGGTLTFLCLPAFIADPSWPLTILDNMQVRANESLLPTRGASLWAWVWHGGITLWLLPVVALVALVLVGYVFGRGKRLQSTQLLGLLIMPVLYASNFVTIIPILKTSRQIVTLTIASWVAAAIDTLAGGWGGAYVLIPITALVLLARDRDSTIIPPIPTGKTAH